MARSREGNGAACARRSSWWVFLAFGLMAIVLLWQEHRAHLLGIIPYLILLACPFMHFLHRGHHGGHGHREDRHA